jgi:hypothetical protein
VPTPEQVAYAKKLEEISTRFVKLEDRTIKAAVGMLQDLRRNIAAEITLSEGFEVYRLTKLQEGIGRTIDQFEAQLAAQVRTAFGETYELGGLGVVEPLAAVGLPAFYQPNRAQVNAVMGFSADLIQQIGSEMRGKINGQLRLGVLGERSPFQVMKSITGILGVKARDLRWGRLKRPEVVKGVAARAEAILRTEFTRIYNLAHHSQQLQTAQEIPDIMKRWLSAATPRTRASHLAAHFRYMTNPIPVTEPFLVGGYKLMFPGDPAGPAEETINCMCREITVHPIIGVLELPVDKEVERERKRRKDEEKVKQPKGYKGVAKFEEIGTATGRALFGGDIGINKKHWEEATPELQRHILAHELTHQTIEDFVLHNQKEWDRAEKVLTLMQFKDGRLLFAGGHLQLGEGIADTIASHLAGERLGGFDDKRWKEITKWADGIIKKAGYSSAEFRKDIRRMQDELNANL